MTVGIARVWASPEYLTEAHTCEENIPLITYKYSAWGILLIFVSC